MPRKLGGEVVNSLANCVASIWPETIPISSIVTPFSYTFFLSHSNFLLPPADLYSASPVGLIDLWRTVASWLTSMWTQFSAVIDIPKVHMD